MELMIVYEKEKAVMLIAYLQRGLTFVAT